MSRWRLLKEPRDSQAAVAILRCLSADIRYLDSNRFVMPTGNLCPVKDARISLILPDYYL
jgi:hypothetical protein